MKKFTLLLSGLFACSALVFGQVQKAEIYNGTVSNIPGIESSAPVTFIVDNSTGDFRFLSDGNGHNVGPFKWSGKVPVRGGLNKAGAVWGFQITNWSDMTIGNQVTKNNKKVTVQGTLKKATSGTGAVSGMTYDGKKITLTIRIPYLMEGRTQAVPIPFNCTLDLTPGQSSKAKLR